MFEFLPKFIGFAVEIGTLKGDVWLGVFLFIAILIFAWAKGKIGDVPAAVVFAVAIMMIVFYEHPDLLWLTIAIYLFANYGKGMFKG